MKKIVVVLMMFCLAIAAPGFGIVQKASDPWQKPVDARFSNTPVSDALDALFKNNGLSYTIPAEAGVLRVTATIRNMPLNTALKTVLDPIGASYRVSGKLAVITVNPPSPVSAPIATASADPDAAITKVVNLKFMNAEELRQRISSVLPTDVSCSTSGSRTLLLSGKPRDVAQALTLVNEIDEASMPKTVTIRYDLTIKANDQEKAPTICEYSTTANTLENQQFQANINISRPVDADVEVSAGRPSSTASEAQQKPNVPLRRKAISMETIQASFNGIVNTQGLERREADKPTANPKRASGQTKTDNPSVPQYTGSVVLRNSAQFAFSVQGVSGTANANYTATIPLGRPTVVSSGKMKTQTGEAVYELTAKPEVISPASK